MRAVDAAGTVVLRKALRRGQMMTFFAGLPRCLVGMEACATAHHWARELAGLGHQVRLMPPQYVKAYVRRQKNDAADAAAICEAVGRPSMRFVPVKGEPQQAALVLHRVRDLLQRQRTMLINALRGHLAEFGIVAPQGPRHVAQLAAVVRDESEGGVPEPARRVLLLLVEQLEELSGRLATLGRALLARHRADPASRRLATIPGIGPITASTLVATVTEPASFRSGREFAAPSALRRSADPCGTGSMPPASMAGAGATPELERRQDAAGPDQQARRHRAAPAVVSPVMV